MKVFFKILLFVKYHFLTLQLNQNHLGFLATVFANLDISPELNSLGSDHPSSGNRHLTVGEPHYADVVTEETSRKYINFRSIYK